jgi:hypothetical protein
VYDPRFEKEGSLNNPMVGLTGWAIQGAPPISTADIWFVHPFGNDFQYYIVPDPQYEGLLSGSNRGINPINGGVDSEYNQATAVAGPGTFNPDGSVKRKGLGLTARKGVLGVETDFLLVPKAFQDLIVDGARVATFGRWIVDCGHDDFHTEVHPPLLMAVATPAPPPAGRPSGASEMTQVQIMSRPYTVSQLFDGGTTNFAQHLAIEVGKVEDTTFGFPHSTRVEAHPKLLTPPYDGRPFIKLLVQPTPLKHRGPIDLPVPRKLMVSFHFTHRTGIVTQVFDAGNGTVGIIIVLGDTTPSPIPRNRGQNIEWSQLQTLEEAVFIGLEIIDILTLKIASPIILALGILTDLYEEPLAASPLDNQNIAAPVGIDQIPVGAGLAEDDNQPYPIYGWLNVWWRASPDRQEASGHRSEDTSRENEKCEGGSCNPKQDEEGVSTRTKTRASRSTNSAQDSAWRSEAGPRVRALTRREERAGHRSGPPPCAQVLRARERTSTLARPLVATTYRISCQPICLHLRGKDHRQQARTEFWHPTPLRSAGEEVDDCEDADGDDDCAERGRFQALPIACSELGAGD